MIRPPIRFQSGQATLSPDDEASASGGLAPGAFDPFLAQQKVLERLGYVPPERPLYQMTPKDEKDAWWDEFGARVNNLAQSWGGHTQYQDPRAARDDLRSREQAKLDDVWSGKAARSQAMRQATPDPYVNWLLALATGEDPGSFPQFLIDMKSKGETLSTLEKNARAAGFTPGTPEYEEFMQTQMNKQARVVPYGTMVYNEQTQETGVFDARTSKVTVDGQERPLAGWRPFTQSADIAQGVAGGKAWGTYDAAFDADAGSALDSLETVKQQTQEMVQFIEQNPDMDTGFIEGRLTPFVNEKVAQLEAMSTLLTIPALAAAKLQPVTEQELETIKRTFASVLRDPKANLGALKAQLASVDAKLAEWSHKMEFYERNGTMQGYGISSWRRSRGARGGGGAAGGGAPNPATEGSDDDLE